VPPPPPSSVLSERYGAPSAWRRPVLVGAVVLLATVFLGWVAWVAFFHSSPQVSSRLVGYEVVDDHRATAFVEVTLEEGLDAAPDGRTGATCRVRAVAADHTFVGDLAFTPSPGRNDVTVRTERRATSVDLLGCTTPDQPRPR
jgi:hypothetical protein